MPPTAIEIKARLDKVVDQEGNVLDMEAVLEIVASLEKIVMTKESLEATRIGKTINQMRKKTSNEDLSKRAKRLVKKWQMVVSNHFKITINPESLNGVVKRKDLEQQSGSLNGNKTEAYSTESESKLASKRKRSSPDNCPLKSLDFPVKPGLSPRLVPSLKNNASPRLGVSPKHGVPPRLGVSPKQGVSPKHGASPGRRGVSPKIKSKIDYSKSKPSGLIVGELGSVSSQRTLINSSLANEDLAAELNCSDFLNHTHQNNNEQLEYLDNHHNQSIDHLEKLCNDSSNTSATTDATATNSTDTRVQEDRIVLSDFISNGTKYSQTKETTNMNTYAENITTKNSEIIPKEFTPIQPEDLTVFRKELPENVIAPESEADGVNGVYNSKNVWCPWDGNVQQRDNELLLLPYVILD